MIEQAPAWSDDAERGVVAEGPGRRSRGRTLPRFRYEVRRWRDGVITDLAEAVEGARGLSDDPDCARRLLELVPEAPTPVWGRDELGAGEMWNSNSLISWLIARSGLDVESIPLQRSVDERPVGRPASSSRTANTPKKASHESPRRPRHRTPRRSRSRKERIMMTAKVLLKRASLTFAAMGVAGAALPSDASPRHPELGSHGRRSTRTAPG